MAGSVNKVILIGNLGQDPEIRMTQAGKKVASFSLATSDQWKDRQTGERRERTEWHRVVVFNEGLCNIVEQYIRKGSKLYVEGQLKTRKWQGQDGKDNYTTEVVLDGFNSSISMLSGSATSSYVTDQLAAKNSLPPKETNSDHVPLDQGNQINTDLDDDIPF